MSASLRTSAERGADTFLARFHGLRDRLPGEAQARAAAAEAFGRFGLPGVRDEAWRYTSLRPLTETPWGEPLTAVDQSHSAVPPLPDLGGPTLVFVDGRFCEDLSRRPDGAAFDTFAHAPKFGELARPDREPLVALNTMLAEDGARLLVAAGADAGTVLLVSAGSGNARRPFTFHPRHTIDLAPGARLTVIEVAVGAGVYLHNPVTEIRVAEDARLTHIRLQDEAAGAFQLATIYAEIGSAASYDSFTLNLGGRVVRTEIHARLTGPGGTAHLNGAQLLGGSQHADITTVVSHDAPTCASRQTVKNVLQDRSRGVFQGKIEVARAAQKTDGYQMSQALLLSPEAEIDCKPQLEIYADDVKCSHGATIGELDEDQLFYLRARGIPASEARSMLVRAFLDDALEAVTDEAARDLLERAVAAWWQRRPQGDR